MLTRSTKVDDKTDVSNETADVLIRRRSYNGKSKKWSKWQVEYRRPNENGEPCYVIHLKLGGTVCLYPNLLPLSRQKQVTEELKNHATYFREYRIQGTKEPRAHFLLHEHAPDHDIDDETKKSPGYKYGQITMKARPLHLLPHLQDLSDWLKVHCGVPCWNIGVDVVSYRDGRDSIGFHADNDQEEEHIVTVIVTSPPKPRQIVFKRMPDAAKKKQLRNGTQDIEPSLGEKRARLRDGDEEIELCLSAGDAYSMDGEFDHEYIRHACID
jgi:alkylated DNA repair dioxygenase AlkB